MAQHLLLKDPTKKPGYKPYRSDDKWKKDLVAIRIPEIEDGEPYVVPVGIRGTHYMIPRARNVRVPMAVVQNLKTRIQHQWAMPATGPLTGMKYLGKHPRFYVMELTGDEATQAPVLAPAVPIGASERLQLQQQAIAAAAENSAAMSELRRPDPHPDLLRE